MEKIVDQSKVQEREHRKKHIIDLVEGGYSIRGIVTEKEIEDTRRWFDLCYAIEDYVEYRIKSYLEDM